MSSSFGVASPNSPRRWSRAHSTVRIANCWSEAGACSRRSPRSAAIRRFWARTTVEPTMMLRIERRSRESGRVWNGCRCGWGWASITAGVTGGNARGAAVAGAETDSGSSSASATSSGSAKPDTGQAATDNADERSGGRRGRHPAVETFSDTDTDDQRAGERDCRRGGRSRARRQELADRGAEPPCSQTIRIHCSGDGTGGS